MPSSNTRGLIQNAIDAAIKSLKNIVAINADRDMKGIYGSPDIVQTILSKIDDCDLFIADVSAVTVYHPQDKDGNPTDRIKASPNPNVLFELGYAVQTIKLDNIICIMNEDYNQGGEIPFDIEHNRLTKFTLKNKSKAEVCRELRDIIVSTILNVMENGKRVRPNFSNIRVGSFNLNNQNFEYKIAPFNVYTSKKSQEYISSLKETARGLVHDISKIVLSPSTQTTTSIEEYSQSDAETITLNDGTILTPVKSHIKLNLFGEIPVHISEEEKLHTTSIIKRLLGEEISENFFEFGELKKKNIFSIEPTYEPVGSEMEKDKYHKYLLLGGLISEIELWEMFLETFDEYLLLPFAVINESTVSDSEITVFIEVNTSMADIVLPTEDVISQNLKGIAGHICKYDIIKNTLTLPEDNLISYDDDISLSVEDLYDDWKGKLNASGINGNSIYDEEDYVNELSKYIATPITERQSTFCFKISTLHANEIKWLDKMILLKPKTNCVEIKYTVRSKSSDGFLNGVLKYSIE